LKLDFVGCFCLNQNSQDFRILPLLVLSPTNRMLNIRPVFVLKGSGLLVLSPTNRMLSIRPVFVLKGSGLLI